jgi:hypothetical protein
MYELQVLILRKRSFLWFSLVSIWTLAQHQWKLPPELKVVWFGYFEYYPTGILPVTAPGRGVAVYIYLVQDLDLDFDLALSLTSYCFGKHAFLIRKIFFSTQLTASIDSTLNRNISIKNNIK